MSKRTPQDKVDHIVFLRKQGLPNKEISEKTGVNYGTVKTIVRRILGVQSRISVKGVDTTAKKMMKDRETMTLKQVADKYGKSIRYVSLLTKGFKAKRQVPKTIKIKKAKKAPAEKLLVSETKPTNIGMAKITPKDKVHKTVKRNTSDYRAVSMFDNKNTVKLIRRDDPRSDEEIRNAFNVEQQRQLTELSKIK